MNSPLIKPLLLTLALAAPALANFTQADSAKAKAYCKGPFIGTTVFVRSQSQASSKAKTEIARSIISQIKSKTENTASSEEKNGVLKEFSRYLDKSEIESNLILFGFQEIESPKKLGNGEYEFKGYVCPDKVAKPYQDSLKIINQRVSIEKISNSFCETLYKTYSPKVMFFQRLLEYFGEANEARIADYKRVQKECDNIRGNIQKGYVSFEEALDKAVAEISSKVRGKTKIAIAEIDAYPAKVSDFITAELESKLVKSGAFTVIRLNSAELAKTFGEKALKNSGQIVNADAAKIGKSLEAKVVITGSFVPSAEYSQLRIGAIEAQSIKILTLHLEKIRPDDAELQGLMPDKLHLISEDAFAHLNKGEDLYREGKYDEAIRELDRTLAINGNLDKGYEIRDNAYYMKLKNLCQEKNMEANNFCGVGRWTSSSKDTSLQIAVIKAKGEVSWKIGVKVSSESSFGESSESSFSEVSTTSTSEIITGVKFTSTSNRDKINKIKIPEPCDGDMPDETIIAEYDFYIFLNGKLAGTGTCMIDKEENLVKWYEERTINVSKGIPDIQIQETYTTYNQKEKKYTVFTRVTLSYDRVIKELEAILRTDPNNADAKFTLENVRQEKAKTKK